MKKRLKMVPLVDPGLFQALVINREPATLRDLLRRAPALCTEPVAEDLLDKSLDQVNIITVTEMPPERDLYRPPGLVVAPVETNGGAQQAAGPTAAVQTVGASPAARPTPPPTDGAKTAPPTKPAPPLPTDVSERDAVLMSYATWIDSAASFLRAGLSVLMVCEKLVVEHFWREVARRAKLVPQPLTVPTEDEGGLMSRSLRQRQLAALKDLIRRLKDGDVLVIPHLDLLAGGSDANLPTESRELIELVYESSGRLLLAFTDPSIDVPEVLASRFAVRLKPTGVPREAVYPDGTTRPLGAALVTAGEAGHFTGYDPEALYKNVAGLNPVRLRHAIKYAVQEYATPGPVPVGKLYQALRAFKAQTSLKFEAPDVKFEDIGGYDDVKTELRQALSLMMGAATGRLSEKLQRELIPRGFIFHGPAGTGKTLFAKAVANKIDGTIQVVSGPEVTDMYVGESERKVRELFAEARRNAPAVLVFDEFDSIATERSGRDDGGTRAGNALVAQILTEMDGFRPDVPMLVIGTTNRLDIIDKALMRPSRFKPIAIGLPDRKARRAIAAVHAKHFLQEGDRPSAQLLDVIAAATEGFNGDEIRSLFRDACVGLYCQTPPVRADARRYGELVGQLRHGAELRAAGAAARPVAAPQPGDRPGPTTPMFAIAEDDAGEEPRAIA
jgi:transitional endoplasmic reticulum ATPase